MLFVAGRSGNSSLYQDLQLVQWQHVLPHGHREPGQGLQAAVRDLTGIQDGRLADLLHQFDADKYEQTKNSQSQIKSEQERDCAGKKVTPESDINHPS